MLRREYLITLAIFLFVALELTVIVPSPFGRLILLLFLAGILASYASRNSFSLNIFSGAYCLFMLILGLLDYPMSNLFIGIVTILLVRDLLDILMYSKIRGLYYLARYYLPFYSIVILIFYVWLLVSPTFLRSIPIQAVFLSILGVVLIYVFTTRTLRSQG